MKTDTFAALITGHPISQTVSEHGDATEPQIELTDNFELEFAPVAVESAPRKIVPNTASIPVPEFLPLTSRAPAFLNTPNHSIPEPLNNVVGLASEIGGKIDDPTDAAKSVSTGAQPATRLVTLTPISEGFEFVQPRQLVEQRTPKLSAVPQATAIPVFTSTGQESPPLASGKPAASPLQAPFDATGLPVVSTPIHTTKASKSKSPIAAVEPANEGVSERPRTQTTKTDVSHANDADALQSKERSDFSSVKPRSVHPVPSTNPDENLAVKSMPLAVKVPIPEPSLEPIPVNHVSTKTSDIIEIAANPNTAAAVPRDAKGPISKEFAPEKVTVVQSPHQPVPIVVEPTVEKSRNITKLPAPDLSAPPLSKQLGLQLFPKSVPIETVPYRDTGPDAHSGFLPVKISPPLIVAHRTIAIPTAPPAQIAIAAANLDLQTGPVNVERSRFPESDALALTMPQEPPSSQSTASNPQARTGFDSGQRITLAIAQAAASLHDRPVELTLSPQELGRVRLTLQSVDGTMSVNVAVERAETLDLLRRNIDMLAEQLRDIGYQDLSFSFAGGNDSAQEDHHDSSADRQNDTAPARRDLHSDEPQIVHVETTPTSGIDIRL